jgi:hypothetical protein
VDVDERWQRLGGLLLAMRKAAHGSRSREWFAREYDFTNARTIFDIERAKRTNYTPATLAQIEQAYGLAHGSIRAYVTTGDWSALDAARRDQLATAVQQSNLSPENKARVYALIEQATPRDPDGP